MNSLFAGIYNHRKILITGHTGFKGSWLSFWLQKMGADICGYSLAPETDPNHFSVLKIGMDSVIADIRDYPQLKKCFQVFQPEIVFHLAAQSLVRRSYEKPIETFETNVMGTANLLEACRASGSVRAVVVVTSDKCYQNNEWEWGYRESDPMGGHDPYSASKGCAELVSAAYRNSFCGVNTETGNQLLVATVRAGNVIGGGDWAEDRLIPDVARAASRKEKVKIRNPHATRPWQHVFEPLSGYLTLGQQLLKGNKEFADAWNFGPSDDDTLSVRQVLDLLKIYWSDLVVVEATRENQLHEAGRLRLDSSKARQHLGWRPVWPFAIAIERTASWYQAFYEQGAISTSADLADYVTAARSRNLKWAT